MNTLRIVFGFIVLVCAIAFASAAYVLVQQSTNWKHDYETLKQQDQDAMDKLKAEITRLNADLTNAKAEQEKWQKAADDLKVTIGLKDTEIQKNLGQIKDLEATTKRQTDDIAGINNTLEGLKKNLKDEQDKSEAARIAKEAAEKAQRDAEDKLRAAEDDIKNLQSQLKLTKGDLKNSVDLNQRYAEVYGEDGLRLAKAAKAPMPYITGKVKNADNGMRLVLITVGKDDGVETGMTFEVVRPDARQYVGRVRVLEVKDEEAVCRIDTAMTDCRPIMEGDDVTTRIK